MKRKHSGLGFLYVSWAHACKIMKPVRGNGGFQTLLRRMQKSHPTVCFNVTRADLERFNRYQRKYGDGGFQSRLKGARV